MPEGVVTTTAAPSSFIRRQLPYNVVTAARKRVVNAFSNGVPVYFGMSGGKDSIALAHIVATLIEEGRIDPSLLTVQFIDEEAMHESVIEEVKNWRRRFLTLGARFDWYCIEVRHFNCFNSLEQDESFMCWDSTCPDRWVRPMPAFAITDHPMLRRRVDTYQRFLVRISTAGIRMSGVRVAESVQRLQAFRAAYDSPEGQLFMPIYDWRDVDVWRYIRDQELDFPETYINLYASGEPRRRMRLSQFFSVDTAKCLVKLAEYDDDLMDRVLRREPNAYLASLYWDTEIFRSAVQASRSPEAARSGATRTEVLALIRERLASGTDAQRRPARHFRNMLFKYGHVLEESDYERVHRALVAGDPKLREARAIEGSVIRKVADQARKDDHDRNHARG